MKTEPKALPPRSRPWLSAGLFAVVLAGLASRQFPGLLPAVLGKYPGDALWGLMVFFGIAWLQPRLSSWRLASLALMASYLVEFSQLYQAPWINAIRGKTLGHLVLGSGFDWLDLVAYTVGIAFGTIANALATRRQRGRA